MSKSDTRSTVLDLINEVRRLLGYNTVTTLNADRYTLVQLRFLNQTIAQISDFGEWQELYAEVDVTAVVSTQDYSFGITHPIQKIYEIAYHTDRQALYRETLERVKQYQRGGGTGRPRFFTIKGVDSQGNPKFSVHPQPGISENGNPFHVLYFKKPRLYDTTSMDVEIEFPANLVFAGVYAKALVEESGGSHTKESIAQEYDFREMMSESINRFNADVGTDVYLVPEARL